MEPEDRRPHEVVSSSGVESEDLGSEGRSESDSGGSDEPAPSELPFEVLLQQRQNGGPISAAERQVQRARLKKARQKRVLKRENKNRPTEQSSKRPVPRLREVLQLPNRTARDPRFDDMVGSFKEDAFRKRYSFVFDEQLPQERDELKKAMQKTKNPEKKKEIRASVTRIEQRIREEKVRRNRQKAEAERKAEEKAAVKAGKKPFFLKASEKKRQELVRRYQELKASGGLEKALAKRRKKNAAKDHRYVPSARRDS